MIAFTLYQQILKAMKNLTHKTEGTETESLLPEGNIWLTRATIAIFFIILNICVFTI